MQLHSDANPHADTHEPGYTNTNRYSCEHANSNGNADIDAAQYQPDTEPNGDPYRSGTALR